MSATEITTSLAHLDEITVVSVVGEIDVASAPAFETVVAAVLADDPIALIVDLSKVDFLATAGLRILAATYEKITLAGGRFAVVADSPANRRPIQLTDLNQLFSLNRTLDDAITSVRKSQGTTAQ